MFAVNTNIMSQLHTVIPTYISTCMFTLLVNFLWVDCLMTAVLIAHERDHTPVYLYKHKHIHNTISCNINYVNTMYGFVMWPAECERVYNKQLYRIGLTSVAALLAQTDTINWWCSRVWDMLVTPARRACTRCLSICKRK